ncbi:unnamed protein product [Rotaria sp. Silwood1]|nr:unnamed protein product [Rotaria sp. Silwood1]CAF0943545.1 unnamed protein product [Rotaria sp. Silwood1]CAF3394904.1 unnamed protein product [Rotaria sp. Silwood1]CAF4494055.1 unnamed protein product [Rotaria sp. Silwood1]CAF4566099.1 unnamed protein product [Rotaria sp. Silwood1]
MLERNAAIIFAIAGIITVLGFIGGVAPGFYIKIEYQNKNQIYSTSSIEINIFNKKLSRDEKILLIFTDTLFFTIGIFLGILFELLFKALNASSTVHIIIGAMFILALLILFIIILILALKNSSKPTIEINEPNQTIVEPSTPSKVLTKPRDGPQNTAARINRYHSRYNDNTLKSSWQTSSNDLSTYSNNTFHTTKPQTTIQKEYQKLLHPSPQFYTNDKVYVNDTDIAQIIKDEGKITK